MTRDRSSAFQVAGHLVFANSTDRTAVILHFGANWHENAPVACQMGKAVSEVRITAISPPEGRTTRIITLDTGHKVFVPSASFPDQLNVNKWSVALDKAERSPLLGLTLILVLVLTLIGGLGYWLMPKLADALADYIPKSVISELSQSTLLYLDHSLLEDSQLSPARQAELTAEFDKLRRLAGLSEEVDLLFRASSVMGANALALPGGPVVLLDGLVDISPSDDGLYGVLAHELAHIALGHNRKQLARSSVFALISLMIGSSQELSGGTEIFRNLLFSGYSRSFEEEADQMARSMMRQAGYDLAEFDRMLIALYQSKCQDDCPEDSQARDHHHKSSGWFDTHPSLSERLSLQAQ